MGHETWSIFNQNDSQKNSFSSAKYLPRRWACAGDKHKPHCWMYPQRMYSSSRALGRRAFHLSLCEDSHFDTHLSVGKPLEAFLTIPSHSACSQLYRNVAWIRRLFVAYAQRDPMSAFCGDDQVCNGSWLNTLWWWCVLNLLNWSLHGLRRELVEAWLGPKYVKDALVWHNQWRDWRCQRNVGWSSYDDRFFVDQGSLRNFYDACKWEK